MIELSFVEELELLIDLTDTTTSIEYTPSLIPWGCDLIYTSWFFNTNSLTIGASSDSLMPLIKIVFVKLFFSNSFNYF